MASHKQEKSVDTQRPAASGEPALEPSNWLAPFTSGTFLSLQNTIGNRAVSQLLQADMGQPQLNGNGNGNSHKLTSLQLSTGSTTIQTKPQEGEQQAGGRTESATQTPEPPAPSRPLIVEDDAKDLQPGQMRKTEFLEKLKTSVCSAAEETLRNTMWSEMGCPYVEHWFSHYAGQSSQHVERALRKYAPETARANSAADFIPIVTERVRRGLSQWAETGEVTGVPEELRQGEMPGMTLQGLVSGGLSAIGRGIGSAVSAVASGIGSAASAVAGGIGGAVSSVGRALFKAREGGEKDVGDPDAIRDQLGNGNSLDGGTRHRMEKAFGVSFGGVRVHTGAKAEGLSESMNARAFTVGNDIAFGAGEYSPGTLIGDALIAHELAHTVQQGNGNSTEVASRGEHGHGALEEEADIAAVNAVASAWGLQNTAEMQPGMRTRLRSGLRLQRCSCGGSQPTQTQVRGIAAYEAMTPWQLSRVPAAEFDRAATGSQPTAAGLTITDYKRAAAFARLVFDGFQIDFDVDTEDRPFGEEPTDDELVAFNNILNQILQMGGGEVGRIAGGPQGRGGRPLQRQAGTGRPTLRGKVRIWRERNARTRGQYAFKAYRLNRAISIGPRNLENRLIHEEGRAQLDPPTPAHITRQERLTTVFLTSGELVSGFYSPIEDTFYLEPGTRPESPGAQATARHEMVHLVGGGERTRSAFRTRYGNNYLRYWRPFEEGMAEFIRTETQPETEASAVAQGEHMGNVQTGELDFYVRSQAWVRQLIAAAPENRQLLMNAYLTGNISEDVFRLLESVPAPVEQR